MSGCCSADCSRPGAVSVEAVEATDVRKPAAVGGGAYVVIVEDGQHGEPALGYRDSAGGFVHRPMPADYPHRPVSDAEEPCPVCGAVEYDEYFPTEGWRAGRGEKGTDMFKPSPLIVCRVCGHEEQAGVTMRFSQPDPNEDETARAARMVRFRAQRWHSDKMTLMAVTFPIYAAQGWPAWISGSGSDDDQLTLVRIAHAPTLPDSIVIQRPQIEVTTSIAPHQPGELAAARQAFASLIQADSYRRPTDRLSDAAATLSTRAARRRRVAGSHQAPVSETEVTIDGTRQPCLTVGSPSAQWVAVRRHHDVTITITITITARAIDPGTLVIEPIADPNARLLGPKPDEP
jgi:hypothetical protein